MLELYNKYGVQRHAGYCRYKLTADFEYLPIANQGEASYNNYFTSHKT